MNDALIRKLNLELLEVDEKIRKAEVFLLSKRADNITTTQDSLLRIQVQAMKTYRDCVFERLCDLTEVK
jgi:hypothetical protein